VYFLIGKKDGVWPQEEATQRDDLVLLDMEEAYGGVNSTLPYKSALWFYLAYQQYPKAMHVLKTDDDSYVKVDALEAEVMHAQPDYWGRVYHGNGPIRDPTSKWYTPSSMWSDEDGVFPDYCDGAGYAMSRKALECLVSEIKTPRLTLGAMEDVLTGVFMRNCGIEPINTVLIDVGHYEDMNVYDPSAPWLIKHHVNDLSQVDPGLSSPSP
jgi:hypothetical protein